MRHRWNVKSPKANVPKGSKDRESSSPKTSRKDLKIWNHNFCEAMRLLLRLGGSKLGSLTLVTAFDETITYRRIAFSMTSEHKFFFRNRVNCQLEIDLWWICSQVRNLAINAAVSCHCHCIERTCIWCVYNIVRSPRTEIVIFEFIWIRQPNPFCHGSSKRSNLPNRHRAFWVHPHPNAEVRVRTLVSS